MSNLHSIGLPLFCILLGLNSCMTDSSVPTIILNQWEFEAGDTLGWQPAIVPGDVMQDLLAAAAIPQPYYQTNERKVQWVERQDWTYQTVLPNANQLTRHLIADPVIRFDGLDTYASVYINDSLALETNNAHRSYSVPWNPSAEACTLKVVLHSAVAKGQDILDKQPRLVPVSNEMKPQGQQTSSVTRKPTYQFGWDWAPRLTGAGISGNVRIESALQPSPEEARISWVAITDTLAILGIWDTEEWPRGQWSLQSPDATSEDISVSRSDSCWVAEIKSPQRWWPNGMGEQPLYRLKWAPESPSFNSLNWKVGVRELSWIRQPDAFGHSFECHVNGQRVQARGANVIPADYFYARGQAQDTVILQQAIDAHMNMIRVWGGAVYPSEEFYDFCDENGLLVWQDFMFACAMVPGDSAFLNNVSEEAIHQVRRLRNHTALALWCGNNESQKAWEAWGWPDLYNLHGADSVATEVAYNRMFHERLPHIVEHHSNATLYWPSSPSHDWDLPVKSSNSGDEHAWRVWFDTLDFSFFSEHNGRFASEYGLQSIPDSSTLAKVGVAAFEDEALQFRQRSKMEWLKPGLDGWGMMRIYARRYTADPAASDTVHSSLQRWIYLTQLTQAIGLREALERHRNSQGRYAGSLYWQLNDVWPTVSWSTIDHAGKWKLGHYAAQAANKPCRIIYNRTDSTSRSLTAHNDQPLMHHNSTVHVQWMEENGDVLHSMTQRLDVPPFSSMHLAWNEPSVPWVNAAVVRWNWLDSSGFALDEGAVSLKKPSEIMWPQPTITWNVQGNSVELQSDAMAYGVRLITDVPGRFEQNGFMLFPGKEGVRQIRFIPNDPTLQLHSTDVKLEHFAQYQATNRSRS